MKASGEGRGSMNGLQHCDILVTNGFVITMDDARRIYSPGAVAITGSRIVAVGPMREIQAAYKADRTYDAEGNVVHPGFIDPHLHIVHGTCRGIFSSAALAEKQPVSFADWKADVTPDDENIATKLAAIELLRSGFTCFVEPGSVFDSDAVAEAAETIGIRALLAAPYLWDKVEIMEHMTGLGSDAIFNRAPVVLEHCLDQIGRELHRNRNPDALVRGYVAVYGIGTASDELLKAGKACADEAGVAFHQHENYIPDATRADRRALGKGRIEHLADLGVLGGNATLVHMNIVADEEVAPLRETGTSIVWCPTGTIHNTIAKGIPCRLPELYKQGVNIAVGVDGALDSPVGSAGPTAFHVARGIGQPLTPENVIEMQTICAAQAAGLADELGSLVPGKRADLVIRHASIESYPATNPVHQLALTAGPGSVRTVIVNGEVVLQGGVATRLDQEAVCFEARESVRRRLSRLGLSAGIEWPTIS
jgi:5-methylthioadenosine/S-adenosylhomocysteine deaminase